MSVESENGRVFLLEQLILEYVTENHKLHKENDAFKKQIKQLEARLNPLHDQLLERVKSEF
jgi:cell division protein FtsB